MIPYTAHEVTDADVAAVLQVLRSNRLTQGPCVPILEERFAAKCGAKYAVACSSGTAALHLAYLACGVGPDTTVVTSPVTFVATANAALYCGAEVVFCDVERETGLGDVPPYGSVGVSLGGQWDGNRVMILDACHGPYVLPDGVQAACFSLHPAKHVAAGEGGMVATNHRHVAVACQQLRDHGNSISMRREMVDLGFNYRLDEMSAALALSQLSRLDANIQRRREIAAIYDEEFDGHVRTVPHDNNSARHLYQLLVDNRDDVVAALAKLGVGTQKHYHPIVPLQPYYRERYKYEPDQRPNAVWHSEHTLSIPLFPSMTDAEIDTVTTAVKEVV